MPISWNGGWGLLDDMFGYHEKGHIVSDIGEIHFDCNEGTFMVNSPSVIILAGHINDMTTRTIGDVQFKLDNKKATLTVCALDGQPIAQSNHLLVSAVGICEKYDGNTMLKMENDPVLYENICGSLTISSCLVTEKIHVYVLAPNGKREHLIPVHNLYGAFEFNFATNTRYEILKMDY